MEHEPEQPSAEGATNKPAKVFVVHITDDEITTYRIPGGIIAQRKRTDKGHPEYQDTDPTDPSADAPGTGDNDPFAIA